MKKLNENLLRKIIIETIEENSLLSEGRKKKIREDEPVPSPVDQHSDVATGMNSRDFDMSDQEAAKMMPKMPSFTTEQIKHAHEVLDQAFALAKSGNPMLAGSPEDLIKQIVKMFKGEE